MTLVIRTEEACRPPSNMGKRALLCSSDGASRGRDEMSSYQIHKEKEMWSRLRQSKDPYLVMLFKTSWGEEGDDVRVVQRPRRGQLDHQKPPPKPRTPVSFAASFAYPPQRSKAKSGIEMPTEEQMQWAERVLAEHSVDRCTVSHRVESITSHISVLKRQGKTAQAEQQREAMDLLLDAHKLSPKPARRTGTADAAKGAKVKGCPGKSMKKLTNFRLTATIPQRDALPSSEPAIQPAVQAPQEGDLANYSHLDFYDLGAYHQKQLRKRKEGPRHRRGSTGAEHEGEANEDHHRKKRHGPQCRYHPDNIHPSFKAMGYKAPFRFPRAELVMSPERSASPSPTHAGDVMLLEDFSLDVPPDVGAGPTPQVPSLQAVPAPAPAAAGLGLSVPGGGGSVGAARSPVSSALVPAPLGDEEAGDDCSCSTGRTSEDTPLDSKVKGWKQSWHLTRARLDHDLSLVLEDRNRCKGQVGHSVRHLGQIATRAVAGGKAWARCRIRPSTGKVPPLKRPPSRTQGDAAGFPSSPSRSLTHMSSQADPSAAGQQAPNEQTLQAWRRSQESLQQVLGVMEEGIAHIGSSRDTDGFRARMAVVLEEGRKLAEVSEPRSNAWGFGEVQKRRLDRAALAFKNLSSQYARLAGLYEATSQRRQAPDLIVTDPLRVQWGRSLWSSAKQVMTTEASQRQRGQDLLAKVQTHFAAIGFPGNAAQRAMCDAFEAMVGSGTQLNAAFLPDLLSRAGPAVLSRDTAKAVSSIAQEIGVPSEALAGMMKDAQAKYLRENPNHEQRVSTALVSTPGAVR